MLVDYLDPCLHLQVTDYIAVIPVLQYLLYIDDPTSSVQSALYFYHHYTITRHSQRTQSIQIEYIKTGEILLWPLRKKRQIEMLR